MTKYAGTRAVVVGETNGIGLAIAKRLVEGGAEVLLTARTPHERALLSGELGSAARVVAPAELEDCLRPIADVDLLFADAVSTARLLLPSLKDGGAIVLTASAPSPASVPAFATELASRGIRVNAVAPGCIEASDGGSVPLPPLGRLGAAEEVARAALFLATDATFTTGARLPVDGGLGQR
ncbi:MULTISPECIES: SDR family NAD(P)-dependent oxidoreductase [unclassified Streptomyces]|uniref:SDR family NAD(P)-dependent oxidoreductase n=1 Tax=unclassified Streptomyces TaxID=2593676 RepID=UPI002E788727|nr:MULTISPECIES: SDR family oxidoreductase [unclassified Streptomyces]MEE1762116.1 SDR family oxidoreductase [Streptomyces sp. SP18BB07]MEE1831324.1 SDR family oxidoreductase [Streptomyces sp. SP17KL33]